MIDSTNPRILANNIRKLFSKISNIPSVEGNPTGSGYNTLLTKLKIGSTKYKLPKDVTANPEAEATGSLTKLKVGDGVYSVGSGSKFVNLATYDGSGLGYAAEAVISLSEDINNFDVIMFETRYAANQSFPSGLVSVASLKNVFTSRCGVWHEASAYTEVTYTSDTSLTVGRATGCFIYAVYGIKY